MFRTAKAFSLEKGNQILYFADISPQTIEESPQVKEKGDVTILSFQHETYFPETDRANIAFKKANKSLDPFELNNITNLKLTSALVKIEKNVQVILVYN